nr:efflux RND transporter periplasmic adaptor subunit [uncultured Holophaga sp.]
MKRKHIALLAGGVVLVAVIAVAATRGEKGLPVQAIQVGREDITAKVSANGKIQAVKKVDISANVMGQVTRLAVKEGDRVKTGDFLLEIDPARSRAQAQGLAANREAMVHDLDTARARAHQARSDFQRAQANHRAGIISQSDFEQSRTSLTTADAAVLAAQRRLEQAGADLAGARDTLAKSTILAPMDGVVTAKQIEQGETAVIGVQNQAGTVLLTISDMSKVEAEMEVDEASIPNVQLGQEAQVRIDAYPNQVFKGQVTEVGGSPILKTSSNDATKFKVKVWIKNPPLTIKPGLSAQADIFTGFRQDALAIPLQSLAMRENKPKAGEKRDPLAPRDEEGVFVMSGGKVHFQVVKTGLLGDLDVEVLEGLKGGEQVVTGPFKALRELKDGDLVHLDKGRKKDSSEAKK